MNCDFNGDWVGIKQRMEAWWNKENADRPIMAVQAKRVKDAQAVGWVGFSFDEEGEETKQRLVKGEETDYAAYWTDFDVLMNRHLELFTQYHFTAETYPRFSANLGVASLALFLGCQPIFQKDTIWYHPSLESPETAQIKLSDDNEWYKWSLDITRRAYAFADNRFMVGIPDITEHLDVLASLFNTQELLLHMIDYPDEIHRLNRDVQKYWFEAFSRHMEIITQPDGFTNFGPFQLLGKGKMAKLQCDVSVMISPAMFDEFVLPYLREQTNWLDKSLYHLDGTGAVKHLDSILTLDNLDALQWTPGAGNADGGDECWDFIYEKALNAGKNIYALVHPANIKRFIQKFGAKGVFIVTGAANSDMADAIVLQAEQLCGTRKI